MLPRRFGAWGFGLTVLGIGGFSSDFAVIAGPRLSAHKVKCRMMVTRGADLCFPEISEPLDEGIFLILNNRQPNMI